MAKRNKRPYLWLFAAIEVVLYFISGSNDTKIIPQRIISRPKITDYRVDNSEGATRKGYDLVLTSYSPRILNYFYDLLFRSSSRYT